MMKTPEQLKGAIRNLSREKNIHAQELMQVFMFERVVERLSLSPYKDKFILKGGLLIASLIGVAQRTTMDMDATVRGMRVDESAVRKAVTDILAVEVDDGISFTFQGMKPIREDDSYDNFRVLLQAEYGKMKIPMKIDITTGDEITPSAVEYRFPMLFEDKTVPVLAYSQETVLAEKYETIIRRDVSNTRARDFYDLHVLFGLYREHANWDLLREATNATAAKRGSLAKLEDLGYVIDALSRSPQMAALWNAYRVENHYAKHISFEEALCSVRLYSEAIQGRERHSVEDLKITAKGRALQKSVNRVNGRADARTERSRER